MTPESPAILERLLRENDLGWMIDMYTPRERAVPILLEQITRLTSEFRGRFGYDLSFSPETLRAEGERNPHKIRAFLQALGVSGNPDMLLMVWRILQGLSIREVVMNYREQEAFTLTVTLARPGEERDELETYRSDDINDAALLRNFGITILDGRPLFDGFFPSADEIVAGTRSDCGRVSGWIGERDDDERRGRTERHIVAAGLRHNYPLSCPPDVPS